MASKDVIEVDGSTHEGGGQVLRISLSLSSCSGRSFVIRSIRANRNPPGLKRQHVACTMLASSICRGRMRGDEIGSQRLEWIHPDGIRGGRHVCDARTAASCTLLAQCAMPMLLYASEPSTLELRGGTDVPMAPGSDYMEHVFVPMINRCLEPSGARVESRCNKRGFYPRGGGTMEVRIHPLNGDVMQPIQCTQFGRLKEVHVYAFGAQGLARTAAGLSREILRDNLPEEVSIDIEDQGLHGKVGGLLLAAVSENGWILGASAEFQSSMEGGEVTNKANEATQDLLSAIGSGGCVDRYMQDQLVVYMAMAEGTSKMRCCCAPTDHTKAAMEVARLMVGAKFVVEQSEGSHGSWLITCHGAGLHPRPGHSNIQGLESM